ncbi:MAG: cysteine--tRNA ligase [Polyangiales bacterium]
MPFTLHDTLTDATIPLPERTPGETSLYVCGPTVYGHIHVGNARGPVVFDVLARHLEGQGRKVVYARNYTDVDDKIIAVAVENDEAPAAVAQRFIDAYREEMAALRCREPTVEPRVSETIGEIVALIAALIEKGSAYATPDGDVYYDVSTFKDYGKLSKRRLDAMSAEHGRGKSGEGKRGEFDFALWKAAKPNEPEGARWPSPWGEGRPGWHIECSAMTHVHLGDGFDIHGGGPDLKFPHHENEIAQSEPVYGAPMARAWMHHGFIEVDIERSAAFSDEVNALLPTLRERDPELRKVSKSDARRLDEMRARDPATLTPEDRALMAVVERKVHFGHWFQLRRLRSRVDGEAVRLWILGTHYRSPLAFDLEVEGDTVRFPALEQAERRVEYFYDSIQKLAARRAALGPNAKTPIGPAGAVEVFRKLREDFDRALDDDLNTMRRARPLRPDLLEGERALRPEEARPAGPRRGGRGPGARHGLAGRGRRRRRGLLREGHRPQGGRPGALGRRGRRRGEGPHVGPRREGLREGRRDPSVALGEGHRVERWPYGNHLEGGIVPHPSRAPGAGAKRAR